MSFSPNDIVGAAVDATIASFEQHGLRSHMAELPRLFSKALAERNHVVRAVLITQNGKADDLAKIILPLIEKKYDKPVDLQQMADPSILGGAVLTIGDERFDLSLRGTLAQLQESLASH